ncbi:MAG: hypothetical protein JST68_02390 [Bacteroidetes bacterium]|nr:hypothetical protein [Bacteroidota bacterium]
MKKILFILLLSAGAATASAQNQDLAPIISRTETAMQAIEKTDRVIERTVFDFLKKGNNTTYGYTYKFYSPNIYHVTLVEDPAEVSTGTLNIYYIKDGKWTLVNTFSSRGEGFNIKFTPNKTDSYKVEYTCTLKNQEHQAGFGLVFDRE